MVNGPLPLIAVAQPSRPQSSTPARRTINRFRLATARKTMAGLFAQILGKLYFFKLRENLHHILLDYEEKRSCTANGAFKSAC